MNGARFVHDTLEEADWDVLIADAKKVKGLAPLTYKTDKIDARVLAELSWRDLVPAVWLPSDDPPRVLVTVPGGHSILFDSLPETAAAVAGFLSDSAGTSAPRPRTRSGAAAAGSPCTTQAAPVPGWPWPRSGSPPTARATAAPGTRADPRA
jgi:hypothetical protein